MVKIGNELSKRLFELDKKDIANFIAMFCTLDVNDEYSSNLGKIIKVGEDTFKIVISNKNYDNILEELVNSDDNINDIFKTG